MLIMIRAHNAGNYAILTNKKVFLIWQTVYARALEKRIQIWKSISRAGINHARGKAVRLAGSDG